MHMNVPYDTLAHCAFLREQSTHDLLSGIVHCSAKKRFDSAVRSARDLADDDMMRWDGMAGGGNGNGNGNGIGIGLTNQ